MQTVLITGASCGIGLTIANRLVENGFQVFGTTRNPENQKNKLGFELLP